jgi:hypothetical protein
MATSRSNDPERCGTFAIATMRSISAPGQRRVRLGTFGAFERRQGADVNAFGRLREHLKAALGRAQGAALPLFDEAGARQMDSRPMGTVLED